MLEQVRDATRGTLDVLELVAILCALGLFAIAAVHLIVATFRVAIRGRVLVLPFGGSEERRVELTELFVRRLTEIEQEWVALAREVEAMRRSVNRKVQDESRSENQGRRNAEATPLASGSELPQLPPVTAEPGSGTAAPRTSGDELLTNVVELGRVGALADADLGVISLAGVSFSPRDILALLRAAPALVARRTLRGTILTVGGSQLAWVEFEQRGLARRSRRTQQAEIHDDKWVPAIEDLAYRLAKDRVYLVRDRTNRRRRLRSSRTHRGVEPMGTRSATVRQAVFEAETWEAARLFLEGYGAHLRHYRYGRASDRDAALEAYERALAVQQQFPRASYNRAVMLYNRYLPDANDRAIDGFEAATSTVDSSLQPLAFAGLAMAHSQAIHRFQRARKDHAERARKAAAEAFSLAPKLEESVFVGGWIQQLDEKWDEAIAQYQSVVRLPGKSSGALRIKSFALNNAAWIILFTFPRTVESHQRAERLLWQALDLYPNKVAYTNLAEIARRTPYKERAVALFEQALALDPSYANAANELAIVQLELGATEESEASAAKAEQLAAADPTFAKKLAADYATVKLAQTPRAASATVSRR